MTAPHTPTALDIAAALLDHVARHPSGNRAELVAAHCALAADRLLRAGATVENPQPSMALMEPRDVITTALAGLAGSPADVLDDDLVLDAITAAQHALAATR